MRSEESTAFGGNLKLEISNAIVRVYKDCFGKGPTRARTYYDGDVVTCVLSDVYTRAEQTLLESGRTATVLSQRQELQEAVRQRLVEVVEHATGREVVGFFSGNQSDPDMAVEVFVLAPGNGE